METRISGGSSVLGDDVICVGPIVGLTLISLHFILSSSKNVRFFPPTVPTTQNLRVIHGRRHLFSVPSSQRDACPTDFAFSLRKTNQQKR